MSAEQRCDRGSGQGRLGAWLASLAVAATLSLLAAPSALAAGFGFGGSQVDLTGLQCATPGNCTAIGTYYDALGHGQAASWTQTSGSWARGVQLAAPSSASKNPFDIYGTGGGITALSCPSARNCSAVGGYGDPLGNLRPALFTEHAGAWSTVVPRMPSNYYLLAKRSPNPTGAAVVSGVSCVSTGNCVAIGYYLARHGAIRSVIFVQHNGSWSRATTVPVPSGGDDDDYSQSELTAISCVPSGTCSAVGTYTDGSFNLQGWVVRISGGAVQASAALPMPTGPDTPDPSPSPVLTSISCTDAQDCAAAGSYSVDSGGQSTGNFEDVLLLEHTGTWSATEAELPAGAATISTAGAQITSPLSVDCPDLNHCSATGYYTDANSNLQGEVIDDTAGSWAAARQVSLPGDAATASLQQLVLPGPVSCSGVGYCAASSLYVTTIGNFEPLLVFKAGGAWSSTPMNLPANAGVDQEVGGLAGVSCPRYDPPAVSTYNDCTVAGIYQDSAYGIDGFATTEKSGGTWGTPTELAPPAPSREELRLSLNSVLKPAGVNARIKRIEKLRGFTFHYRAVQRGKLTVHWSTRRRHQRSVAQATVYPRRAGGFPTKVRLTRYGRALLKGAQRVELSSRAVFTPRDGKPIAASGAFTLHK